MSDFNVDKDVQKNLVSVLGAAGLRINAYEVAALSRWVRRAKANSYWDKLIEVIPFCGIGTTAARYKLKWHALNTVNPMTYAAGGFANASYSPRPGFTGDGASFLNTGFIGSTMLSNNTDLMVAFGINWNGATNPANTTIAGVLDTGKGAIHFAVAGTGTDMLFGEMLATDGGGNTAISGGVISGFYAALRTSATSLTYYRNAASVGSTATNVTGVALPTRPFYVYGRNNAGTADFSPVNHRENFFMIGTGFTAGDMTNLYNDYVELMGNLRRPLA